MTKPDLAVDVKSMRYPSSLEPADNLINNIVFLVPFGGFVSMLGPSGAGKTTLLRIIAGLECKFEGTITLGGSRIVSPTRRIQIVFQENRLLPWKSAAENIAFAMRDPNSQENQDKIEMWIKKVDLEKERTFWPKSLSGGEQGRVAFARTFVDPPQVLLLDEPFRNLDFVTRFRLQDVLRETLETAPMTVVMVSHNIEDAILLSDTVCVLSRSPMEIKSQFSVNLEKPRDRNSPEFRQLTAQIEDALRGK
jgi:sulfonate transport system ATP-binding protein